MIIINPTTATLFDCPNNYPKKIIRFGLMTCLVHTSRFTPVDGTDLGVFTLELVVRNVQVNFSEKSLSFSLQNAIIVVY